MNVDIVQIGASQLLFHLVENAHEFIVRIVFSSAGVEMGEIYARSQTGYFAAKIKQLFQTGELPPFSHQLRA